MEKDSQGEFTGLAKVILKMRKIAVIGNLWKGWWHSGNMPFAWTTQANFVEKIIHGFPETGRVKRMKSPLEFQIWKFNEKNH